MNASNTPDPSAEGGPTSGREKILKTRRFSAHPRWWIVTVIIVSVLTATLACSIVRYLNNLLFINHAQALDEFTTRSPIWARITNFAWEHHRTRIHPARRLGFNDAMAWMFAGAWSATMIIQPRCQLRIDPRHIDRDMEPVSPVNLEAWQEGILAHELAHCLVIGPDLKSLDESQTLDPTSLSPWAANTELTIEKFKQRRALTEEALWQEAWADLFMVGYWRVNWPTDAQALTGELESQRLRPGEGEDHRTICWLRAAREHAGPTLGSEVFDWSRRVAMDASGRCRPKPKTP